MNKYINFDYFDYLPTGICIIDKNYKIIFWNNTLENWTKYQRNTLVNNDLRKYFPLFNDKRYSSRIDELFIGGPPIVFSSQIHKFIFPSYLTSGEMRIQHTVVSPIPTENGEYYAMFSVEDVTEITKRTAEYRKLKIEAEKRANEISKLNEELTKINEALKETNLQKDKFFSIISHDLKSPFNGFLGLTKIIVESFNDIQPEEILEMLKEMLKSANVVWELLETLLEWARSQTGRMKFEPSLYQISDLLTSQKYLFDTVAANKDINLVIETPDKELFAYFDFKMIDTVTRNLVSNALKFTSSGGTVRLVAKENIDEIVVSVIDDGVGIPEENLNKLFRLDTQVTTLGTSEEKGTGLGLILCKDFVEKNLGKIWVESELGKGTKFSFTLKKSF